MESETIFKLDSKEAAIAQHFERSQTNTLLIGSFARRMNTSLESLIPVFDSLEKQGYLRKGGVLWDTDEEGYSLIEKEEWDEYQETGDICDPYWGTLIENPKSRVSECYVLLKPIPHEKPIPVQTITENTWIPYSKVVEARGVRIGDRGRYMEYDIEVQDNKTADGTVWCKTVHNKEMGFCGAINIESILFEVKAQYTFK